MAENKIPLKIFLCYAHTDVDIVRALYYRLESDVMTVWFDKISLLPGQDWRFEIRNAIHESDIVIVCHSKQFNQRGNRHLEVNLALDEAKRIPEGEIFIIPARLEECSVLDALNGLQWVDLFSDDGYEKLLQALMSKIGVPLIPSGHQSNSINIDNLAQSEVQYFSNFINRDKEISFVMDRVSDLGKGKPFAPNERIIHFVGPSGIGKSFLLERFYKELGGRVNCVPLLIRLGTLKGGKSGFAVQLLIATYEAFCAYKSIKPEIYSGRTLVQFAKHVHQTINISGKDQVIVLFLDDINIPSNKDMREIEEYFLENFLHGNNRSFLITAGRSYPSVFNDFALRPNSSNILPLSAFDEEKTRRQIELLKPGAGKLAKILLKLGSGVPGNTVKLAELIIGDPLGIPNEMQAIQSLLDVIKKNNKIEAQFYPMLEAISILQGFFPEDVTPLFQNHPQLEVGWDERRVKEVFLELSRIKVGPGGLVDWDRDKKHWAMDESTRDLFEKELQMRDPELWKKLHCTALGMYQKWGENYNSDLYRNKSTYHKQRLQSVGLNCSDLEG